MNERPELGDLVKCKVTGYVGVLVSVARWITGCDRVAIQSQKLKDEKPPEMHHTDITMIDVVKKKVVEPQNRAFPELMTAAEAVAEVGKATGKQKGGPRPFIPQR